MSAQAIATQTTQATLQPSEIYQKIGELPSKVEKFVEMATAGLKEWGENISDRRISITRTSGNQTGFSGTCFVIQQGDDKICVGRSRRGGVSYSIALSDNSDRPKAYFSLADSNSKAVWFLNTGGEYYEDRRTGLVEGNGTEYTTQNEGLSSALGYARQRVHIENAVTTAEKLFDGAVKLLEEVKK